MGRKGKEVSNDVKNIINHFKRGLTESAIAEMVDRPRTTIHYIIKKFKTGKPVENKHRSGRPRKFSESDERWILREIKKNPRINATELTKNVEHYLDVTTTPQTVRNVVKRNGFHARSARKSHTYQKRTD